MRVLVLDNTYQPVDVWGWQDAMLAILTGKAEVVEEYEDEIHSATKTWRVPSIIRKLARCRRRKKIRFTKLNLFARDEFRCQYCAKKPGTENLTFEHVIPQCQGGKDTWENVVAACWTCNQKKRGRTPEQAGMKLLRKPVEPRYSPALAIRMKPSDPQCWRDFLYWNTEITPG